MTSPLVQGGLEVPIKVSVMWDEPEKLSVLVPEVKEVEYPMTGEYGNDLINILQELGIEKDEYDNDGEEFQTEAVDNKNIEMLEKIFSVSLVPYLKTSKGVLSLIELVKRTLSGPSVLNAFYYPRFFCSYFQKSYIKS